MEVNHDHLSSFHVILCDSFHRAFVNPAVVVVVLVMIVVVVDVGKPCSRYSSRTTKTRLHRQDVLDDSVAAADDDDSVVVVVVPFER